MTRPGDRPPNERKIPVAARRSEPRTTGARGAQYPPNPRAAGGPSDPKTPEAGSISTDEHPRLPGPPPSEASLSAGHELRDMRTQQTIRWLGLLAIAVIVLVVGITIFESAMTGGVGPLKAVVDNPPRVTPPPAPRLEGANGEVLGALHERENPLLNNYTWIDQAAGTVRIPVDRAIELTAQRGLPVRPGSGAQNPGGLSRPQDSSSGRTLEITR